MKQLLLLVLLARFSSAIQWLAVSKMSSIAAVPHHTGLCNHLRGALIPKQVQFCRENPSFMEAVKMGAMEAISECQFQFRTQRWNCSALTSYDIHEMMSSNPPYDNQRGRRPGSRKGKKGKRFSPKYAQLKSSRKTYSRTRYSRNSNKNRDYPPQNRESYSGNRRFSPQTRDFSSKIRNLSPQKKDLLNKSQLGNPKKQEISPLNREYSDGTDKPQTNPTVAFTPTPSPPKDVTQAPRNVSLGPSHKYEVYSSDVNKIEINTADDRKGRKKKRKRPPKKAQPSLSPFFSPVVPRGTREAAFVHAISSAGVAHAITLRCSSGALEDCGCDHSVSGRTSEGFQWSGCSHNIAYGVSLSKRFVDARDKKKVQKAQRDMRTDTKRGKKFRRVARALINLHNNEAGRQLVEGDMRVGCKCHGVSGSCELKTCWRQMPSFREVGENLKLKFDDATEVRPKKVGGRLKLMPTNLSFQKLSEGDLVFGASSPEYCDYDPSGGSLGTHGRVCNKSSRGLDGCDLLCCDRGYTSSQRMVPERCSCKFHWCCFVECQTCIKEVTVHTCN